MTVEVVLQT